MRLEGLHRRRAGRRGCHAARRHPGYELTSSFIKPRLIDTWPRLRKAWSSP